MLEHHLTSNKCHPSSKLASSKAHNPAEKLQQQNARQLHLKASEGLFGYPPFGSFWFMFFWTKNIINTHLSKHIISKHYMRLIISRCQNIKSQNLWMFFFPLPLICLNKCNTKSFVYRLANPGSCKTYQGKLTVAHRLEFEMNQESQNLIHTRSPK